MRDSSLFMPQVGAEEKYVGGNDFLSSLRVLYTIFLPLQGLVACLR